MKEVSRRSALVTGATGFIGGHLSTRLAREGWQVKLLVRDAAKLPSDLRSTVEVIVGDLGNANALGQSVTGISVVFHCAANVKTWDTTEAYNAVNVTGVENLLNAIASHNPGLSRLVHISTADVYGFPVKPCDENGATPSTGFGYGDSKLRGEILLREFCSTHHIPYTILRPTNVIGPKSQFIERIGSELQSGLMLKIDHGKANAGIIYIDTLTDYLIWAAEAPKALSQCYNVRDNYDVSWAKFIRILHTSIRGRGLVIDLPFGLADAVAQLCEAFYRAFLPTHEPLLHRLLVRIFGRTCGHSAEKIRTHSGLHNQLGFEEAMRRSIKWFLTEKPL